MNAWKCITAAFVIGACLAGFAPVHAQSGLPAVRATGKVFPVIEELDIPVTYTDGYEVLIDVRYPAVPPGPKGWPLIVVVHGLGEGKDDVAKRAECYAGLGYFAAAYDVRGQGKSMALNDQAAYGFTFLGLRERIDLAEVMEAAESLYPGLVDFERIGVSGTSQGGAYSWIAAAHSERTFPPNPWRTDPFPRISCVMPRNMIPLLLEMILPESRNINSQTLQVLFVNQNVHWDPAFTATLRALILAEDYGAILGFLYDPDLDLGRLLESSKVPVLAMLPYDDYWANPEKLVKLWGTLPDSTPRRLNLTTGGHGTPWNFHEEEIAWSLQKRWFQRFLLEIPNGVDREPSFRSAVIPEKAQFYQTPEFLLDFRELRDVPFGPVRIETWFLQSGGALFPIPPSGTGGSDPVDHHVPGWFDISYYIQLMPSPDVLKNIIPLSSVCYDSAPASEDRHLCGTSRARLHVSSSSTRYLIHAALFDVDPQGGERYVTGGFTTVRDNLPPGENVLNFTLGTCSYVIRAGHRLRLRVENLAWHRPACNAEIMRVLPVFESSTVHVLHDAAHPSKITVPYLPFPDPRLIVAPLSCSARSPERVRIAVHSDSAWSGMAYRLLPTRSGTSPGVTYHGMHIPLNPDELTLRALMFPNQNLFRGFAGVLEGAGSAGAFFLLDNLGVLEWQGAVDFVAVFLDQGIPACVVGPEGMTVER